LFVIIVNDTRLRSLPTAMCVRAQTSALELLYDLNHLKKDRKAGERPRVEITNTSYAEKEQQPPLRLVEFQAAERSFRQPTATEVAILTFWKLRYARSHAQELSNEFARLLNRGSSLE
jgi:hypothetical protein